MYIGKVGENTCQISGNSPNWHVCMTGISGSGKTSRLNQMEVEAAKNGCCVIVLDINGSHADDNIFLPVKYSFINKMNRIGVLDDGLAISFLQPVLGKNGCGETLVSLVNSAVYALGAAQKMGAGQIGALREAVTFAVENRQEFPDEMAAVAAGLMNQKGNTAKTVYERMWTVLHSGVFRENSKKLVGNAINVIDFAGMDKASQAVFIEIFLACLWRFVRYQNYICKGAIVLVIDEFQNLSLREGSVLRDILREGRKLGINLWLVTQTLGTFVRDELSVLNQAATKLYFRPNINDINKIAKEIEPENPFKWLKKLSVLRIGEAVASGSFNIGNTEISHPIVTA